MSEPLTPGETSVLFFAARYAHSRQTGAAWLVVTEIIQKWPRIDPDARKRLISESDEATCNFEDWTRLKVMPIHDA